LVTVAILLRELGRPWWWRRDRSRGHFPERLPPGADGARAHHAPGIAGGAIRRPDGRLARRARHHRARPGFLEAFDAGKGQRCYLYGTRAPFLDTLAYYKQLLKDSGRELFKSPPMQQFDLGRFQEQTMAYPPSVVVKDYASGGSAGYLHVVGTKERRYQTIVQIVPATGK
jgi:hypothetical protein